MIAIGPEQYGEMLAGMHEMDVHAKDAPWRQNLPVLMGLLNVWNRNFLGTSSVAVLPYEQYLVRFPAYLQQLTMESNGKSVRLDGEPVDTETGAVFWGEPGTNGQHSFYQLIHQGTTVIPSDFFFFRTPVNPLPAKDAPDHHDLLVANCIAQSSALAFGKTAEEVAAEGVGQDLVSAKVMPGNRPSSTVVSDVLNPRSLGRLIALYEHSTFTQGVIWGIDSFDQWGVELGKVLARKLTPLLVDGTEVPGFDSSTYALAAKYRG
jgi:glucose-6-phosphate isomerase